MCLNSGWIVLNLLINYQVVSLAIVLKGSVQVPFAKKMSESVFITENFHRHSTVPQPQLTPILFLTKL